MGNTVLSWHRILKLNKINIPESVEFFLFSKLFQDDGRDSIGVTLFNILGGFERLFMYQSGMESFRIDR